jgi:NhaA family Na+:H+ antiporter
VSQKKKKTGTAVPPLDAHGWFEPLFHNDLFAAVLLLASAVVAMVCANLSLELGALGTVAEFYHKMWHLDLGVAIHTWSVTQTLHLWINDGLMAIFFFLVGLEIKRELMVGELATFRKAALPIGAAVGGMVCPALIYTFFNYGTESAGGWGIPMATDIAFAVGVIGLLSGMVPFSLSVFLMALAIVDDLGAVVVIAVFYTNTIAASQLLTGLALITFSAALGYFGVRSSLVYAILFAIVWVEFLLSGVHATVAGVLFAFTIPVDARYETHLFADRIRTLVSRFVLADDAANPLQVNAEQQRLVTAIEQECLHVEAPLQRIERLLHPMCALLIMPLFAFANAGIQLDLSEVGSMFTSNVTLGVMLGLLIGKQVGITGFSWLMVKAGLAELPQGVTWKQIYGVSVLGSIGFTMSLFITELAFSPGAQHANAVHAAPAVEHVLEDADAVETARRHNAESKLGVLSASLIAGVMGIGVLSAVTPRK